MNSMSQAPHETIGAPNKGTGGNQYPPQSAQNQASLGVSNLVDGSEPIFSMYLEMATEEDKKMVEDWKADADRILIFSGLFSAAVASLTSVSIKDIRQNPQDTSNFYLANICATLADPSQSNISSSLPASPPPFSPPTFAVWVNALWFLSLVISLACALFATLLQQWARRYLKLTQSRYSLHKQARIRAFLAEGVEKLYLPWVADALPTLLHVYLFLFFAGLVVFLSNVDLTIFRVVLSWVGFCTALYGCITFMPLICRDSPYHTPLSLPVWHIVTEILFLTFRARQWLADAGFRPSSYYHFRDLAESYEKLLMQGMRKTIEETALELPSEIDARAFMWTFDSLDEDHELERFFSGLPGFRSSKVTEDPLSSLTGQQRWRLHRAMAGLLGRTFSSDLLPASVKERRAMLCAKAADSPQISGAFSILPMTLSQNFDQDRDPLAAEILEFVRGWGDFTEEEDNLRVQANVFLTMSIAATRDDSWFILASKLLGVSEGILRDYAANDDSLSLALLNYVIHQQFIHFGKPTWPFVRFWGELSAYADSIFNVQDTSPELQHEFCALWNQIVPAVQNDYSQNMIYYLLRPIRGVYIALHQNTNSAPTQFSASTGDREILLLNPSIYPVCNVPGHHPDSTLHINASPTLVRDVPHDYDHTAPIPATPPNPVTAHVTHGSIDTSARMTQLLTLESSASAPPTKSQASTSPSDAVAVEHAPISRTPSLVVPLSPSPTQVLDDILSTGLPLSSNSVMTGFDNASLPVSRSSILTPNAPGRLLVSSAPDPGAADEGEGSARAALRKEMDASSRTRDSEATSEDIMATPDRPPQSPLP